MSSSSVIVTLNALRLATGGRRETGGRQNVVILMIPGAIVLALVVLAAFIWSLRYGQYDDPAAAAARVLLENHRPK
jgi:cbb3-type cytochrome oxidase maturation protein